MAIWQSLHFLRPEWFWALLPLIVLVALLARRRPKGGNWQSVVDPALLPHLLIGEGQHPRRWPLALITLAGLLGVTALAGPVWQKLEQPLFSQDSSLVILLDLSRSMDASDTRPSRLARARLKVKDILERRREGETALIAYAADAFVVTPLTSDSHTIASQLSGLTTDLMPAQGSRPDLALAKGVELLHQASRVNGSLLLVTDGLDGAPASQLDAQISRLRDEGYQLLLLGVGSEAGAPIPLPGGGFLKDREGNIVLASLDSAQLQRAALQGGGLYQPLSADERDIDALLAASETAHTMDTARRVEDTMSDQWQEEGPWLLLPLLAIALLAFRRGVLLLALVLVLPLPREGMAAGLDPAIDTLWLNRDQRAQQAFEQGDNTTAAGLFEDRKWRAAAHYRNGDYQQALEELQGIGGSDAAYNRGNALAQMGELEQALAAYEEALRLDPKMADATFNRDRVREWLKESSQQQDSTDKPDDSDDNSDGTDGAPQQGQSPSDPNSSEPNSPDSRDSEYKTPGEEAPSPSQGEPSQGDAESQQSRDTEDQQASPPPSAAQRETTDTAEGDDDPADEAHQAAQQGEAQQRAAEQLADELAQPAAEEDSGRPGDAIAQHAPAQQQSNEQRELSQATEQWLRRIPDDPSGLWRRKFEYQYKQQQQLRGNEEKPW